MDETQNGPRKLGEILRHPTAGQWDEPKPQPAQSSPAWLAPASREEVIMALMPCLTIAAPSGMSLDDRTEWFMAAAGFLDTIPAGLLAEAARKTAVDHPSKIVPAIKAYAEAERADWEWRNRPATKAPRLSVVKPEQPKPKPMTQAEVDALNPTLVSIGLKVGALVRDEDGKLRPVG